MPHQRCDSYHCHVKAHGVEQDILSVRATLSILSIGGEKVLTFSKLFPCRYGNNFCTHFLALQLLTENVHKAFTGNIRWRRVSETNSQGHHGITTMKEATQTNNEVAFIMTKIRYTTRHALCHLVH